MDHEQRQEIERKIAVQCINDLHNAGFAITVDDGEMRVVVASLDHNTVLEAMMTTDIDWLRVSPPGVKVETGWVMFVYGNDGFDVISDYTTNLEPYLAKTFTLAEQLEGQHA